MRRTYLLLPHPSGSGSISLLPGQSFAASEGAPASLLRQCVSQKPFSPACTPLHEVRKMMGGKNYSVQTHCCSFAETFVCLFAALVHRGFSFLFSPILIGLCCHGLDLQLNTDKFRPHMEAGEEMMTR